MGASLDSDTDKITTNKSQIKNKKYFCPFLKFPGLAAFTDQEKGKCRMGRHHADQEEKIQCSISSGSNQENYANR